MVGFVYVIIVLLFGVGLVIWMRLFCLFHLMVLLVLFVGCFTWCDVGGCSPRCGFERLVVLFRLV